MAKTSTVSKVVPTNKPYESQYGTLYGFYITFENGDNGKYNSKDPEQTKFVVGETATYDFIGKDYNGKTYYTVKPVNPEFANVQGGDTTPVTHTTHKKPTSNRDELIVRQTALKASAELGGKDLKTVLANAEQMVEWVLGTSTAPEPVDHFAGREKVKVTESVADTDLPF